MPEYFDTHSHPYFKDYDNDRGDMFARMEELGVWTVAVGTSLDTSRQAVKMAQERPDVWASIGIHPNDFNETFDSAAFDDLATQPRVVAVGECGLDYFRTEGADSHEKQKALFKTHIQFALKHDLPLILHIRPSKGTTDAHNDAFAILDECLPAQDVNAHPRGISHFFTSTPEVAQEYVKRGFMIAFPGVVTFAKETQDAIRSIPLERIVAETDSPYAAPVPRRGRRNEPSYVAHVYAKIAELREEDEVVVKEVLTKNALKTYRI